MQETYQCAPCNFEYEHLFFDTVPRSMQKPVPPCPLCNKELTPVLWDVHDDYSYYCDADGGCGLIATVEYLKDEAPATRECFDCKKAMRLGPKFGAFGIVHGNSMTKGASVDVAIGRTAEERWGKIGERKEIRDKFRKETGNQALNLVTSSDGKVYGSPIKGAHLESVKTVHEVKVPHGQVTK